MKWRRPNSSSCARAPLRPAFQGKGLGRKLTAAIALYRQMGFKDIAPYRENPIEGAVFLELAL